MDLRNEPPPASWGVAVDRAAIEALAKQWKDTEFPWPEFSYAGTPEHRDEHWWFDYATMSVSVLACLWPPEGEQVWHVEHDGEWLDDAPAVFAAFSRQLGEQGLDLARFAALTDEDGHALFAGRGTLQLIPERVRSLRETAEAIRTRWDGSVRNLVEEASRDGTQIVRLLNTTIPAFADRPQTSEGVAAFDKLSHLAAAIMAAGVGWSQAGFVGYDDFPVYPDYMLPRVFRHYGAMVYSTKLAERVDQRQLIDVDSDAEHAIRWATIYCGAQLTDKLRRRGVEVAGPALDYRLWSIAVLGPEANQFGEHHRTLTMAY